MNPYITIAALLAFMGAGWGGFRLGVDHEQAAQARTLQLVTTAVDAANQASAKAISQIKINNTTIKQEVEHETRTHTIYASCHHSDSGLQLVNAALTQTWPDTVGTGQLPASGTPAR